MGAARTALKETAYYLGIGIANLIRGLAPEAVIVGGPIVRAWPVISSDIKHTVEATICRGLPSTRIIASTLGPEPTLMGALSLVLASKFASSISHLSAPPLLALQTKSRSKIIYLIVNVKNFLTRIGLVLNTFASLCNKVALRQLS